MEFAEFVLISEISDVLDRDTSNISFKKAPDVWPHKDRYNYEFEINNNTFNVVFTRYDIIDSSSLVLNHLIRAELEADQIKSLFHNVFEVEFTNDGHYQNPGTHHTKAVEIYAKILSAIKKFSEIYKVDGFQFTPADEKMQLVYDRFIKQFTPLKLVDKKSGLYLTHELIVKIEGLIQNKGLFRNDVNMSQIAYDKEMEKIKDQIPMQKQIARIAPNLVGKLVYTMDHNSVAIITQYNRIRNKFRIYNLREYHSAFPPSLHYYDVRAHRISRLKDAPAFLSDVPKFIQEIKKYVTATPHLFPNFTGEVYDGPVPADYAAQR